MSDHDNWTPELRASVERIQAATGVRRRIGYMACVGSVSAKTKTTDGPRPLRQCRAKAVVYENDGRARGWLRFECPRGCWGDIAPSSQRLRRVGA